MPSIRTWCFPPVEVLPLRYPLVMSFPVFEKAEEDFHVGGKTPFCLYVEKNPGTTGVHADATVPN